MIKHNEIEIEAGNPFGKCQLDRKKYADVLTNIISTYANGFVLAINNKWGTGKTTFIRMWEQDLKYNGFQTVLFNAWENDFENNALTALMGELKTLTKKDEVNPHFENALKKAAVFTKNLAPVLVKAVVKKYVGVPYEDLAEGVANSIGDIFERDVNEYADKKKSIKEFRASLSKFITDTWDEKPIVFIIDELDRCRPDYAVSILEQIKHFFSIPNIVFVLSIDKEQLGHAVRGVYGSESIDADEYLRRFIDIEYSIPEPDIERFVKYLYNYYVFDTFFKDSNRLKYQIFEKDGRDFIEIITFFFKNKKLTLRQQEKIFAHCRLTLRSFQDNMYVFPQLYVFLIFMKFYNNDKYIKFKNKELEFIDVQNFLFELTSVDINENNIDYLIWLESYFLYFYNKHKHGLSNSKENLIQTVNSNEYILLVKSLIDKSAGQKKFLDYLLGQYRDREYTNFNTIFLLNKIDLLDPLHS